MIKRLRANASITALPPVEHGIEKGEREGREGGERSQQEGEYYDQINNGPRLGNRQYRSALGSCKSKQENYPIFRSKHFCVQP